MKMFESTNKQKRNFVLYNKVKKHLTLDIKVLLQL